MPEDQSYQIPLFDDNGKPTPVEIPLTRGYVALVDPIDADLLSHKWYANKHERHNAPYAVRAVYSPNNITKKERLHRVILSRILGRDLSSHEFCDHINGNGLDNRRCNLRVATYTENNRNVKLRKDNTSGYKGVYWNKQKRKWRASIYINGRMKHLGTYDKPEEAAQAYDNSALRYFGDFAALNKPHQIQEKE